MNLLFLDIDGVLNSDEWFEDHPGWRKLSGKAFDDIRLCPSQMRLLNQLLEASGAKIVVSSSWRLNRSTEELRELLRRNGCLGEVLGKTPEDGMDDFWEGTTRDSQIERWLLDECPVDNPTFVILDDRKNMGEFQSRLVLTTEEKGLQPEHIEKALALFSL